MTELTSDQLAGIIYDLMGEMVENPRYLEDAFDLSEFPLCTTGWSRAIEAAVNVLVADGLADWTDGESHINFRLRSRDTPN